MSTSPQPAEVALSAADHERDELSALQRKQTLAAHERRLQKAAAKDPAIAALYEERNALSAALAQLRAEHASLSSRHDGLAAEASRLASENSALAVERDRLQAQLAAQADELASLRPPPAAAAAAAPAKPRRN